ncbi:type I restriction-modification HsdS subunit [Brachyspira sp. CAG:700]|nr:type I restriction-modification HsdS subunit [Brachyspira sp. CAG:700]
MNKLPEDWEIKKLKDIGNVYTGITPPTSDKENFGNEHLFVTSADIKENKYIFNSIRKLSNKGFEKTKKFKKGDILYVCIGSIGKIALAKTDFSCNQQINVLRVNKEIDNEFIYYQLMNSFPYISKFISKRVVPIMNKTTFENLEISLPSLDEQKRIASALSKIDAYLENTIKLIEEKERFKRGIAKKLLTCKEGENIPEARFKGFEDEWETVMLGDILSYEQPKDYIVKSEEYNNKYKYPVLTAGKTFILGYTNEEFGIYNKLPVIIFDDFTTDAQYVDFPFKVKSSAIKILKSKYYNTKLIYELIKNIKFNARTHKRYYISEYQYLKIKIPKSIKEQEDISGYLSLLDKEIDNLKKQKELIKEMKRGAMQKLLSGEVRLLE